MDDDISYFFLKLLKFSFHFNFFFPQQSLIFYYINPQHPINPQPINQQITPQPINAQINTQPITPQPINQQINPQPIHSQQTINPQQPINPQPVNPQQPITTTPYLKIMVIETFILLYYLFTFFLIFFFIFIIYVQAQQQITPQPVVCFLLCVFIYCSYQIIGTSYSTTNSTKFSSRSPTNSSIY